MTRSWPRACLPNLRSPACRMKMPAGGFPAHGDRGAAPKIADCRPGSNAVMRTNSYQVRTGDYSDDVISVYLILRRYWGYCPKEPMDKMLPQMAERRARICARGICCRGSLNRSRRRLRRDDQPVSEVLRRPGSFGPENIRVFGVPQTPAWEEGIDGMETSGHWHEMFLAAWGCAGFSQPGRPG